MREENMLFLFSKSIKILRDENGIALVSALMLGLIGMLMVASLVLLVDSGTWISGSKVRYQVALDAAHGGMNFFAKEIVQKGLGGTSLTAMSSYGDLDLKPVTNNADFLKKLTTTGDITVTDGSYPTSKEDVNITFNFPAAPSITVNTAILSTSRGNSGTSSNILQGGGVVNANSGTLAPQHIPYLYQTQTVGQSTANPRENAGLSSLYAY
jgi:hypothetical protein